MREQLDSTTMAMLAEIERDVLRAEAEDFYGESVPASLDPLRRIVAPAWCPEPISEYDIVWGLLAVTGGERGAYVVDSDDSAVQL